MSGTHESQTKPIEPVKADKTKKRRIEHADSSANVGSSSKIVKVHPFFSKSVTGSDSGSAFKWIKPSLGPGRTCLYGVHLDPVCHSKIAAFDLDGTIIKSSHLNRSAADSMRWEWWRSGVPSKLKELHESGFSIVIVTNQAIKARWLEDMKKKVPLIAEAMPHVPFRLFAATAKDGYRKPMIGIWNEIQSIYSDAGVEIDKTNTFFVGDAAGRVGDFASTDRKWALNVGIPFLTPEEYFLKLPAVPFQLPGFHVKSLPALPQFVPKFTPLSSHFPLSSVTPEIVLFVGYPCLGKSSLFRRYFEPAGYMHINQDTLGSRPKCIKATKDALADGKSCVIDNTNRNAATRKFYVDLAKDANVPIRCLLFTASQELAWHNNLYRAYNMPHSAAVREPARTVIPYIAFTSFKDNYEEPALDEGFGDIVEVNWVFTGSNEERKNWEMWLQIDGK